VYNAHGKAKTQDIVYDGIFDENRGNSIAQNPMNICISEIGLENLYFTQFDLSEGEENIKSSADVSPFSNCQVNVTTDVSFISSK